MWGEKLTLRLSELGIQSLEDLLFHFPLRYQDRTHDSRPIGGALDQRDAVIKGRGHCRSRCHDGAPPHPRGRQGRRRLPAMLTVRFFHFRQSQVCAISTRGADTGLRHRETARLAIAGNDSPRVSAWVAGANLLEEALTPVYPTVSGLGQTTWRNLCQQALKMLQEAPPEDLLAGITDDNITLHEAIAFLHNPPRTAALSDIQQGLHPAQSRLAREELIAHQLTIQGVRDRERRHSAPRITGFSPLSRQFLKNLPFSPTNAQERVAEELAHDMAQGSPMLRLVQGDVGSGKTLVAARAILDTVAAGYQVAFMAPTELLAEQHFQSLEAWLTPLALSVNWLSGRIKGKARKTILGELAAGTVSILVGTHALFQDEVVFRRLGLIVVDEQHRFGVHQRLHLAAKGVDGGHPHQLALTATPIPRSLAMVTYGDLDCSVIDELPPGRTPITTTLIDTDRREAVIRRVGAACGNGRQAYWVCTAIEESDSLDVEAAEATRDYLGEALPEVRIGMVHGRMKAPEKAEMMANFKSGFIQLLVATTVIEVGVDVPNASLMIIDNAERLGLAQLHQLRGRVGRGVVESHCLLLYRQPLSETARERLQVMQQTHDGFVIAEADLRIRGPGELLGTRQTGMAQFRIARLPEHESLLIEAQAIANNLYTEDSARTKALIARWAGPRADFARV